MHFFFFLILVPYPTLRFPDLTPLGCRAGIQIVFQLPQGGVNR